MHIYIYIYIFTHAMYIYIYNVYNITMITMIIMIIMIYIYIYRYLRYISAFFWWVAQPNLALHSAALHCTSCHVTGMLSIDLRELTALALCWAEVMLMKKRPALFSVWEWSWRPRGHFNKLGCRGERRMSWFNTRFVLKVTDVKVARI